MSINITCCAFDKPGNIGGPVSWLMWLLPALQKRGFSIHCLIYLHTGEDGPMVKFLNDNNIPYHKTNNPETLEESIRWTLSKLQEVPTDIFIPNVVTSANYACKWVRKAGICTIGILHSDEDYYEAIQHEFYAGRKDFRMSGVVAVSKELERQLLCAPSKDTSVYRIPYGAPIPEDTVTPPIDTLRVAFFGRLATKQKRIKVVAKEFCNLVKNLDGVEAIIYGDGPDRKMVESILEHDGKGLRVSLGGSIASHEVQKAMLQCHVIVLLSDYEGLPISIMEAMACGVVPVCRYNKSGIPELIEDGVNGYILNDEPNQLTHAISKLKDDTQLWNKFSQASRSKILNLYSMDHGVDLWSQTLKDQVEQWRRPGKVKLPIWISLPSENCLLQSNAGRRRKPLRSFIQRRLVRTRMFAGKIKQVLLPTSN